MLPDFITTPKNKRLPGSLRHSISLYFQLNAPGFLRTGIAHAVLYILSKEEVKEGGEKGVEFSEVQG